MSTRSYLYFEDDPMSRQVMQRMIDALDPDGSITIYSDSEDFVARCRAMDPVPSIVFLDVQIRPLDGFQMLDLLRAERAYDNVPIIAMTASVTVSEIESLKEAGFDGLIAKPVRKRLFAELVGRILDGEAIWYVP